MISASSGAVFADAGSLWDAGGKAKTAFVGANNLVDDNTIRASVGASLMWNSPVGPLRMDYAEVLSKASVDKEQQFRFGASTKF